MTPLVANILGIHARAAVATRDATMPTCKTAGKGERNGICNRTACDHTHAIHYNRITKKYYCTPCARRLNEVPQWDGIPLCSWPTREQVGKDRLLLDEVPEAQIV